MNRGLEPIAAIGKPPAGVADGDRRGQRPPEGKRHVGNKAEHAERDPKYLPLHMSILDASGLMKLRRRTRMFQIEMYADGAVSMISKRMQNDS